MTKRKWRRERGRQIARYPHLTWLFRLIQYGEPGCWNWKENALLAEAWRG